MAELDGVKGVKQNSFILKLHHANRGKMFFFAICKLFNLLDVRGNFSEVAKGIQKLFQITNPNPKCDFQYVFESPCINSWLHHWPSLINCLTALHSIIPSVICRKGKTNTERNCISETDHSTILFILKSYQDLNFMGSSSGFYHNSFDLLGSKSICTSLVNFYHFQ